MDLLFQNTHKNTKKKLANRFQKIKFLVLDKKYKNGELNKKNILKALWLKMIKKDKT